MLCELNKYNHKADKNKNKWGGETGCSFTCVSLIKCLQIQNILEWRLQRKAAQCEEFIYSWLGKFLDPVYADRR